MVAPFRGDAPRPAGLVLAPFRALRYDPGQVGDLSAVTAPPYDVIDDAGQRALEERHPYNVVRLTLPRDRAGEPGTRYAAAAGTLADWRRRGVLRPDPGPALYVYEQRSAGHIQRGLLGAVGLAPPQAGIVLPHENTMSGPVADRLALTEATSANLEPIFLVYEGGGAATEAVTAAAGLPSLAELSTPDGTRHRLWRIEDPATLAAVAADLLSRRAVIADGHHRYATYLRYQADRRVAAGPGPWDRGLAFLVDTTSFGPQVEPIHRTISGLPFEAAIAQAGAGFRVTELPLPAALESLSASAGAGPAFVVAGGGRAALLTQPDQTQLAAALPAGRSDAWRRLDVTVAHSLLIGGLWGLPDDEQVVGFAHDVDSALTQAGAGVALLLNPTPVGAVADVARAGDRMPRKSTLFMPKPRTGLVLRLLELDG